MARNSALNRFLEEKQKQDGKERNKRRPPLCQLATAGEVKKWIPSIKKEIDYLLQQVSGAHVSRKYSDQKIEEFKSRVDQLQREHRHFVTKVRTLDPSYHDIIPWELRVYRRKRSHDSHVSTERIHGDCKSENVVGAGSGLGTKRENYHITFRDKGESLGSHMTQTDHQSTIYDNHQTCDGLAASRDSHMTQCCDHKESHRCHMTHSLTKGRLVTPNPLHLEYLSSGSSDEEGTLIKRVKLS